MKEVIKGFKRGLLWCAVILSGIVVVTIVKAVAELCGKEVSHEN